ncbi:hypothetical protein BMS3Abin17_01149 [archaeon BMS3Abin17]|nr:hypothetical protein BMS3Abin17_01149 [archaeon BMS3Abin17]HDZ61234.1 hypothetical protein [Candidatus Pacearchaeota archaeon]
MAKKKASELKEGDIISIYGEKSVVKKIETSGKGIKQGKVKCRIETESLGDKSQKVIIRLADDILDVE